MANIGSPFENTCIMAGIGSFVLIVNSFVITRWGYRRVFLGCGLAICGVSQLIMAVVYTMQPGTERTGKVLFSLCYRSSPLPDRFPSPHLSSIPLLQT